MTNSKFFGAIFLISGTSIGAGMLALPVATAQYGLWPTLGLFLICWAALAFTALLILEVNLWLKADTNLISMAKHTLGKSGEIIAWVTYLLLLYALMSAYLSGINSLLARSLELAFNYTLNNWLGSTILIALFGLIVYLGPKIIDYLNRCLFIGLIIAYLLLIYFLAPHVDLNRLLGNHSSRVWLALPIVATSFGFHIIIPSLRTYLNDNVKQLRLAIIIGSASPLVVYIIWEILILGVLPVLGHNGLLSIYHSGQPAAGLANSLDMLLGSSNISIIFKFFALFAISTSFIGVAYSLFDFLADGFNIQKTHIGRLGTALLTFVPPLIFALFYPRGFIIALGYAGVFVAILLGLLPIFMAYRGRVKLLPTSYQVRGGNIAFILASIFFIIVIIVQFITAG